MRKEWIVLGAALFTSAAVAGGTTFSNLDTNHDGKISQEEAAANPSVAAQFDKADSNQDGSLEESEFSAMEAAPAAGHEDSGMEQQAPAMEHQQEQMRNEGGSTE